MTAQRVPITTAAHMGIAALAAKSVEAPILLTSHGRPVAVIGSAEHLEGDSRSMREAAAAVLDAAADLVSARGEVRTLEETCARLGLDVERVRALAAAKRAG